MNKKYHKKPYREGVNAIVIDNKNNFLLVQKNKYKDNEWNFLGGGRKEDETLKENLFRELSEEIGAEKENFEIIGISSHKIEYDYPADTALKIHNGKYRGQSYNQVILRFIGNKDKLVFNTKEIRKHKWVQPDKLEKYLIFPKQYSCHKKAIDENSPGIIL
ncbi:MAG: NUDIX domain-containing protein [Candidatus Omnitrophota bacterium]